MNSFVLKRQFLVIPLSETLSGFSFTPTGSKQEKRCYVCSPWKLNKISLKTHFTQSSESFYRIVTHAIHNCYLKRHNSPCCRWTEWLKPRLKCLKLQIILFFSYTPFFWMNKKSGFIQIVVSSINWTRWNWNRIHRYFFF